MLTPERIIPALAAHHARWQARAQAWHRLQMASLQRAADGGDDGGLVEWRTFGANPGALRMFTCAPPELSVRPALIVALHGCAQTAAGYSVGGGWTTLAGRYGFAVVLPQQPGTCFNWFDPDAAAREARSIGQMTETAIAAFGVDPRRVFVTGLSAGGAMTSLMLATRPDLFAGGAIIAGLPLRDGVQPRGRAREHGACPPPAGTRVGQPRACGLAPPRTLAASLGMAR